MYYRAKEGLVKINLGAKEFGPVDLVSAFVVTQPSM
jgi:hypothetical protein